MTEELLRRWVRDELPPDERHEVTRWMVRCTSPELGPLLQGLIQELRDERADRSLSAVGGAWSRLVDAWRSLLDAGRAELFDATGALALASLGEAGAPPLLDVVTVDGAPALAVRVDAPEVAAYLTGDDAQILRVLAPTDPSLVTWPLALPASGSRPTVWVVWGPQLPRRDLALDELDAALSDPSIERRAARWVADEDGD